jgi:RND family efflux transporter MFP subunit
MMSLFAHRYAKVAAFLLAVVSGVSAYRAFVASRARHASPFAAAAAASAPAPRKQEPVKPVVVPTFAAVLLPPQMANVAPRRDGKLVEIPVKVGQLVKKGDLLAAFDARERQHDLAMAVAQLKAAQGSAAAAGADFAATSRRASRRNASVEIGGQKIAVVSGEEAAQSVLDARSAAGRSASASAQVSEGRARIAQLKLALEETELRAPYDGVVTGVFFEAGTNAHANETVVRMVGAGRGLRVRIGLPEEEHARLATAKRARVDIGQGRSLMASIDRIAPEVEPASRTFLLEGSVEVDDQCQDCAGLAGRAVRASIMGP